MSRIGTFGRLYLDENEAAQLLQATACSLVFTLLGVPESERDMSLSALACDAAFASITLSTPVMKTPTIEAVAVALRARLGEAGVLTEMERGMMREWLDRIAHRGRQAK